MRVGEDEKGTRYVHEDGWKGGDGVLAWEWGLKRGVAVDEYRFWMNRAALDSAAWPSNTMFSGD